MRQLIIFWVFIIPALSSWQLSAQSVVTEPTLKDTEQVIEVDNKISDDAIAERLSNILISSNRFQNIDVAVEDGIVFIQGETQDQNHKQWAENLATRTEGVIAVINNIEIKLEDAWSFQPAVDETLRLYDGFIRTIPKITIAAILLLLTWFVGKLSVRTSRRILDRKLNNPFVLRMVTRLIALPVFIIGLYLVLQITGLTKLALTLLGGTGLMGVIIGLAFKDIAENFLASMLISVQRPFKIGDLIKVDDHEGVVQSVTTRGTVIMTLDGNHIQIPNSTIYKTTIINVTANPKIRQQFSIGIGYNDGIAIAQQIAVDTLLKQEAILKDPPPEALVDSLGSSTVNLEIYFWVDGTKNSTSKVKSAAIRLVKRAFDAADISMPDEAREMVFPEGIRILSGDAPAPIDTPKKPAEPLANKAEDNLQNDEVTTVREQGKRNQLTTEDQNLISDDA
ncbi:mechanosensitive ion channel family protein [Marinicella gelatinilytica]|uniref:mechanosensitive ion channel family protein n=1 Tax=Marinicella gelatinilytica TaxID=2996017 RepID=UPI002260D570|nr:mechanosensitive ion channel family protein [Marinicella gelatinilytica]MCX7545882.1 mechanosensitive ion channel family protein [Marinicella gelatinilytica]